MSGLVLSLLRAICESLSVSTWAFQSMSGDMFHSFLLSLFLHSSKNVHVAILFILQATYYFKGKNIYFELKFMIMSRLGLLN